MRLLKAIVVLIILCLATGIGFVYLAPEQATSLALDVERKRSGLEKKEINLSDHIRYVYLEGGKGEPLMLLHGFGANKDNFTRVARFLTPHYRVIIPDHIGFGDSSRPQNEDYGSLAQAVRIRTLAQALGIKDVHVGGSSMGGHISMMYAFLYPDEVKSLWLIDPGGIWSAPPGELHEIIAKTGKNPLMAKNEDEFAEIFSFVMTDHPFIPRPILNVMAQERIRNYELEQRIFKQLSSDASERYVKEIKTPTLIVWGEKDRVISPQTAPILNKLLQNSEIIIMKGLGHLPMIEQPKIAADDYLKFRKRLAKQGS
ncbi:MAG TPA: alpha/beta hydrolase [Smithella sp.]|jgi:pimeloyl-ACP methyl ester carboxylesterase|nr:alpha/beta hydrolase [Smithella sp.]HNQ65218.1 alpha/beta hydrolase [Smithella sp.]HOO35223.1 alpha/beta hydrolase [Smithella sp.]HPC07448.1 alpha/beta hydrolase [Smithella sp.]HPK22176.1 alpha/beta hydrolase [Smithella sp.]